MVELGKLREDGQFQPTCSLPENQLAFDTHAIVHTLARICLYELTIVIEKHATA